MSSHTFTLVSAKDLPNLVPIENLTEALSLNYQLMLLKAYGRTDMLIHSPLLSWVHKETSMSWNTLSLLYSVDDTTRKKPCHVYHLRCISFVNSISPYNISFMHFLTLIFMSRFVAYVMPLPEVLKSVNKKRRKSSSACRPERSRQHWITTNPKRADNIDKKKSQRMRRIATCRKAADNTSNCNKAERSWRCGELQQTSRTGPALRMVCSTPRP